MIPKTSKLTRYSFLAAFVFAALLTTEARRCGAGQYCGSLAPRSYRYSRDPFSLVSDIFTMPLYTNSLMRQLHEATEPPSSSPRRGLATPLRYDVTVEEDGMVELALEVPGVTAKNLEIELEKNERQLRIRGTRQLHGSTTEFDQVFQLDPDVDPERLEASLSAGILTVRVPKRARLVQKIPITTAEEDNEKVRLVTEESHDDSLPHEEVSQEEVDELEVTEEEY